MFNTSKYCAMPYSVDTVTVKLDDESLKGTRLYNEEFKMRCLDGGERLDFLGIEKTDKKSQYRGQVEYILAHCIIDGDTNRTISNLCAQSIVKQDFDCAMKLFDKALEVSNLADKAAKEEAEEAEKNSAGTDTPSTTDDTAKDTDSTQE